MNYSSNEQGEGILTLTPLEKKLFEEGKSICHPSGDRLGMFTITAKLTRPNSRAKRFPVEFYGENYKPEKNPVSASVTLTEIKEKHREWMRSEAEQLLCEYDFDGDEFCDSDGWEWDSSEPNKLICTIFLKEANSNPYEPSHSFRFCVDFTGDKPIAEVY